MIDMNIIQHLADNWDIEGIDKYLNNLQDSLDKEESYFITKVYLRLVEDEKAYHYLDKALSLGHSSAILELDQGLEFDGVQIFILYDDLFERYENSNNPNILYQLGILAERWEFSCKKDYLNFYQKAADMNHIEALYMLGIHYLYEDKNKGYEYIRKAANFNHPISLFIIGYLYYLEHNPDEAKKYFEKSIQYTDCPKTEQFLKYYYYVRSKNNSYTFINDCIYLSNTYNNPYLYYYLGCISLNNYSKEEIKSDLSCIIIDDLIPDYEAHYYDMASLFKKSYDLGYKPAKKEYLMIMSTLVEWLDEKQRIINKTIIQYKEEMKDIGDA